LLLLLLLLLGNVLLHPLIELGVLLHELRPLCCCRSLRSRCRCLSLWGLGVGLLCLNRLLCLNGLLLQLSSELRPRVLLLVLLVGLRVRL
jgi:hypothetical protein